MNTGRPKGYKMTNVSKRKISRTKSGHRHSAETRQKIGRSVSNTLRGGTTIGKLQGGMRIIGPEMFNYVDGKWDYRDLQKLGHQLYGICTMDGYPGYAPGTLDKPDFLIPDYVCDRRKPSQPEFWRLRHKQQFSTSKRLWPFWEHPEKSVHLHSFMIETTNMYLREIGKFLGTEFTPLTKKREFGIFSFITISNGIRFHWKITAKNVRNRETFRAPVLAKVDGVDAANFSSPSDYMKLLTLAGGMVVTECEMTPKVINTNLVCNVVR